VHTGHATLEVTFTDAAGLTKLVKRSVRIPAAKR
jgi:hypothetical protein